MPGPSSDSERESLPPFEAPRALYIHVPVCSAKCPYCDFHSLPVSNLAVEAVDRFVEVSLERARRLAERFGAEGFDTVYVGGGTPTCLAPRQLDALLGGIGELAGHPEEWTVEANPESLDERKLGIMAERGATRLSLGIQSLDPTELAVLGRVHDARRATEAVELASASGLSVSVDFIAGAPFPARSDRDWAPRAMSLRDQLLVPLERGVDHVSVYDLVLEPGSPLARSVARGEVTARDPDELWEARAEAESLLNERGLVRYEVSNYAKPGRECRHNEAYWRLDSYLGVGPSAVSTLASSEAGILAAAHGDRSSLLGRAGTRLASLRIEETRDLDAYRTNPGASATETPISPADAAFETIMMAFRTRRGLDTARFRARFGVGIEDLISRSLAAWHARIVAEPGSLALDPAGLDLLNRFLVDCLAEMETGLPAWFESREGRSAT